MMLLRDKVAIVTGAASGIGRSISLRYAAEGASVALCDINMEGLQETLRSMTSANPAHKTYEMDVSSATAVQSITDEIFATFGRIDILVSNAGAVTRATLLELTEEEWDLIYSVNIRGAFLLTKAVGQHMVSQGEGGTVLYVASTAGKVRGGRMAHYASSKAALIHFSRCVALELGVYGIRANAVCPGPTETPFLGHNIPVEADFLERHNIVLGRIAKPMDVANAALFLASPAAEFITGQALNVDGGEAML
jgi:NAD(P)-dependent dehydrogenase (short-subunit alcohol dehydrogenase family)